MTADMSVAPEIARLAETLAFVPDQSAASPAHQASSATHQEQAAAPPTVGTLARRLRSIAASPERWWALVRFEPDRSVTVTVEEHAAYRAWLVILPPGDAGQGCDCDVATMIAGEATDGPPASAVLRPGAVRVHGGRHALQGRGAGYSISLHARAQREVAVRKY